MFQTFKKKREQKTSWPDVGPRSAWEKLSQMFHSKRRDSESSTDIDRQNQRLRHESWAGRARYRGPDPPSGHSVCTTAGDAWRAPARCLVQKKNGHWCVETDNKSSRSPSDGKKKDRFSGLGEERRTPRATSRLDHGSTGYLRGRHLHSLHDTKRVGRGLILFRDRRSIVAWAFFESACWPFFNVKAQVPPRAAAWTSKTFCKNVFSPVFPIEAIRGCRYLQPTFFSTSLKTSFCGIVYPLASVLQ